MMPGCDNGEILPAHFDPKAPNRLLVEGCGGLAKLDLSTGKYACTDADGLVGAPYEMVPRMPGDARPTIPADRRGLPRCTSGEPSAQPYLIPSASNAWVLSADGDVPTLVGPKGEKIELEPNAPPPTLSLDETMMAYDLGGRVVLRAIPSGALLGEIVEGASSGPRKN
jgi:hypothetical protein